jgi:hypothetical protein
MTTALPKLEKLKPNPNWAKLPLFNRKNWTHLRFGDIVENVNERVEPSTAAEAIYVDSTKNPWRGVYSQFVEKKRVHVRLFQDFIRKRGTNAVARS